MEHQSRKSDKWTIDEILKWTTGYFAEKGIATPRLDAEILLAHALSTERLYLYLNMDRPLSSVERSLYRDLVKRRALREPVALITGKKEFWSTTFRVVPGVLIPRPETEVLVEVVLQEIQGAQSPQVLEIGTGSGAISVTVARQKPGSWIVATDIDTAAVAVARLNAADTGVSDCIDFAVMNLFDGILPHPRFHVICSNPPYVPTHVVPTLAPEITRFEPLRALDGGPDGLDAFRKIVAQAPQFLKPTGSLILEMGDEQEEAVRSLFSSEAGLSEVQFFRDLSGKPRVVKGKF